MAIACGGFVAGTVDIGAASLIDWLNPMVVLQAVASGILGRTSFTGGAATAAFGLVLQWAMSLIIASVFVTLVRFVPAILRWWIGAGLLYGVLIDVAMHYVVLPLSAAPFRDAPISAGKTFENLGAMLLFGIIVAASSQYLRTRE